MCEKRRDIEEAEEEAEGGVGKPRRTGVASGCVGGGTATEDVTGASGCVVWFAVAAAGLKREQAGNEATEWWRRAAGSWWRLGASGGARERNKTDSMHATAHICMCIMARARGEKEKREKRGGGGNEERGKEVARTTHKACTLVRPSALSPTHTLTHSLPARRTRRACRVHILNWG